MDRLLAGGRRTWVLLCAIGVVAATGAGVVTLRADREPSVAGERAERSQPDPVAPALPGGGQFVPDAPADRAVLWAVGDGPDGDAPPRAVGELIRNAAADKLLYLGDVYEDVDVPQRLTDPTYEGSYAYLFADTYGELADRTAPTVGNHEWENAAAPGYDTYWSDVYHQPVQHYYRFRAGGWEVISLNSEAELEGDDPQVRWLESELTEPGTCRLAFLHRPRFSAGRHGDEPELDAIWTRLEGHATLVVSGHDHDMQQLEPQGGVVQLVSGAGGRGRYEINETDARLVFSNDTSDGALRLELTPGAARLAFVSVDGRELHHDEVSCQPLG
jgi:hypothetical protein